MPSTILFHGAASGNKVGVALIGVVAGLAFFVFVLVMMGGMRDVEVRVHTWYVDLVCGEIVDRLIHGLVFSGCAEGEHQLLVHSPRDFVGFKGG
jgi:hypothetical protein